MLTAYVPAAATAPRHRPRPRPPRPRRLTAPHGTYRPRRRTRMKARRRDSSARRHERTPDVTDTARREALPREERVAQLVAPLLGPLEVAVVVLVTVEALDRYTVASLAFSADLESRLAVSPAAVVTALYETAEALRVDCGVGGTP